MRGVCVYDRADRKKSPYGARWSSGGKYRFQFFSNKTDRDAFITDFQKRIDLQGRAILSMSAGDAMIWAECVKLAGSAPAVLQAVQRMSDRSRLRAVSLTAAQHEYEEDLFNKGCDEDYRRHVKKALGRFPSAGRTAFDVSSAEARSWAAGLSFAPRTVRGHVKTLTAFWNWMVLRGYVAENIFKSVPVPVVSESEPGFLTVEQMRALMKAAQADYPDAVAYFALGAFAGLRSSAICRMDWAEHIRFEQRGILITGANAKNKRRQFVDGHEPNLWAWLEWAQNNAPEGFDLKARLWERRREQVAEKAGVVMPHNALRHSFCTFHCALYGDAGKTATLLTHRGNVAILYQHYKGNAGRGDAEKYFSIRP
jgi:site-specific recombinase XerC